MNIYISGIGGVGMGPLAQVARDSGHTVFGSDLTASPITDQLISAGVNIVFSQDSDNLRKLDQEIGIDWFAYTAGLSDDNPELIYAKAHIANVTKRDKLLSEILKKSGLKLIGVSGTHGKTTTTAMLIWAFKQLGIPESYSVGTTLSFGPSGHFDPDSSYFIYECDEFDRNMLHFHPYLAILPSIGYDHPDTYPTKDDYNQAFWQFIKQSDDVIAWKKDIDTVGADQITGDGILTEDQVMHNLKIAGEHNRRNATLVLKVLQELKLGDEATNRSILESFPGSGRRFEMLADNLYSDYGHHPDEIAATLELANEINSNVVLVYQPHQNTRQHEIADQYGNCMEQAEKIYWLPTYLTREDQTLPVLTPDQLVSKLVNYRDAETAEMDDNLWQKISDHRKQGQLVLVMGAGTIDGWIRQQLGR